MGGEVNLCLDWAGRKCTISGPPAVVARLAALYAPLRTSLPESRLAEGGRMRASVAVPIRLKVGMDLSQAELDVARALLESDRSNVHLHGAAAVDPEGRAVLALGSSGSGKSSLAYAWYRLGHRVLGDDVVPVDGEGSVHAFPRALRVDLDRLRDPSGPGGAHPHRDGVPLHSVAWSSDDEDVWLQPGTGAEVPAGWALLPASVGVLAACRFEMGAEVRVEPLSRSEMLRMVLNSLHETGLTPRGIQQGDVLDRLVALVEGSAGLRVVFGDSGEAARLLMDLAARPAGERLGAKGGDSAAVRPCGP